MALKRAEDAWAAAPPVADRMIRITHPDCKRRTCIFPDTCAPLKFILLGANFSPTAQGLPAIYCCCFTFMPAFCLVFFRTYFLAFEAALFLVSPRGAEGPKATTVTRIATPTLTIPVTVDTCEKPKGFRGLQSNNNYEDREPDPRDACSCPRLANGMLIFSYTACLKKPLDRFPPQHPKPQSQTPP